MLVHWMGLTRQLMLSYWQDINIVSISRVTIFGQYHHIEIEIVILTHPYSPQWFRTRVYFCANNAVKEVGPRWLT